jgi:SAM-dependent methyltransferase
LRASYIQGGEAKMEEIIRAFGRAAGTYEDWYRTPLGDYVFRSELKGLEALLPESGLGAEIGSGTGIFAEHLTTEDRKVLCVDPSAEMVSQSTGRGLPTLLGVAEKPPLKPHVLDFMYLVTVLEFLVDPSTALSSLRTPLKPKAPLVALAINRESPWGQAYLESSRRESSLFRHARFYTLEEGTKLMENAGYEVVGALMALNVPPGGVPEEPKLYAPEERRDAGVFLLKCMPAKN